MATYVWPRRETQSAHRSAPARPPPCVEQENYTSGRTRAFQLKDHVMTTTLAAEATHVAADDDRVRYNGLSITLHWLTAVLVVLLFVLGEFWGFAARPTRQLMIVAHMSFGIVLTLVLIVRIGWRVIPGHRIQD